MSWVRDAVALSGVGLAIYGTAQWSHALAFVVGGLLLVIGAFYWSMTKVQG